VSPLDLAHAAWRKSSRSNANGDCVEVAPLGVNWRTSSRSNANGNCVEVAPLGASWRKSSRSNHDGNCVEVAAQAGAVAVRDSKDPAGPVLGFPAAQWQSFVDALNRA